MRKNLLWAGQIGLPPKFFQVSPFAPYVSVSMNKEGIVLFAHDQCVSQFLICSTINSKCMRLSIVISSKNCSSRVLIFFGVFVLVSVSRALSLRHCSQGHQYNLIFGLFIVSIIKASE